MTYVCIKCRRIWTRGKITNHASGALCEDCMTDYIRGKQRDEGYHDCYKRAVEYCSRECKWKDICCKEVEG